MLIRDLSGKLVLQQRLLAEEITVDLSGIPSGINNYQVKDRELLITSDKLVKIE